jgi:geranylgeranyl pyrophosphate synthase
VLQLATSESQDGHEVLRSLLDQSGALEYAQQQARRYAVQAARRLDWLAPTETVDHLRTLTQFVVRRLA